MQSTHFEMGIFSFTYFCLSTPANSSISRKSSFSDIFFSNLADQSILILDAITSWFEFLITLSMRNRTSEICPLWKTIGLSTAHTYTCPKFCPTNTQNFFKLRFAYISGIEYGDLWLCVIASQISHVYHLNQRSAKINCSKNKTCHCRQARRKEK